MKISGVISNTLSKAANSNFMVNHIKKCDNPKFLSRTLLLTSVAKDVFAYGLRVHNTLNNDSIPEDKKRFSADMDMASGITTAVVQIGTGFLISNEKLQNSISNKLFKSLKDNARAFNAAKTSFNAISTMVVATLLAKRILTPLIATKLVHKKEHKNDLNESKMPPIKNNTGM